MAEKTETTPAAPAAEARKGKQITAVLTPEEYAELKTYRFKNEIEQYSSIVKEAVLAFIRQ